MPHKNTFSEEAVINDLPSLVSHSPKSMGWDIDRTGEGVKIAIIDTGKPDHNCLVQNIADSINFTSSPSANDTIGQSTIVAGIIGANDPDKIVGIAPSVELYFAKINNDDGTVELDSFVASFLWCIIKNVDIIVMPMTTDISSDLFKEVVDKAINANICIITSSGFKGYTQYPGSYEGVLSVGALKQNKELADFSQDGKVNMVGTSICSTYVNQTYCVASGSAIATAAIGGLAALVVEEMKANGLVEPIEVYKKIEILCKGKSNGHESSESVEG